LTTTMYINHHILFHGLTSSQFNSFFRTTCIFVDIGSLGRLLRADQESQAQPRGSGLKMCESRQYHDFGSSARRTAPCSKQPNEDAESPYLNWSIYGVDRRPVT
jgi:hypothetical protein